MRIIFALLIFTGCQRATDFPLEAGECVLGDQMAVWQVLREDEGTYLMARTPVIEGSPIHIVKDLRTFKKVECP